MHGIRLERGEDFFRLLARGFQVERIGAQVDLVAPGEFAERANLDRAKDFGIVPGGENTLSCQGSKVDEAAFAAVKSQREFVSILGCNFNHFVHCNSRLTSNAPCTMYGKL